MKSTSKIVLPLAVVAAGVLVAVVLVKAAPEAATQEPSVPPPLVRVIEVAPRDVALDVTSQGNVEPRTEATLVAQVSGQIVEVAPSFAAGGAFGRGDVLVRIDPADYRLALAQAEARVAQAATALAREQAEARVAREEWQALQRDGGEGDPPSEPDPLVLHEPQLAEARASVASAEAQLEQARLNLERTAVTAPFAGRVRETMADVGQSVTAGAALGRIFATDYAEVELPIPVAELAYLDVDLTGAMADGPPVSLSASLGGARHTWPARIVRTAGAIEPSTRMLGLVARVDRPLDPGRRSERRDPGDEAGTAAALPMGLFVDATIAGRRAEGVYVLPRAAMREGGRQPEPGKTASLEGTAGWVLVAEAADRPSDAPGASGEAGGDGSGDETTRLRFRRVEVLRLDGDRAIVSGGLAPGERVAISPLDTPVDGMAVRLTTVASPARPTTGGHGARDRARGGAGMNRALAWFAENRVAANLLMVLVLGGGLLTLATLHQEVFPEVSSDIISVTVAYPGAAPEEVEDGVVTRIEDAIEGIEGIKEVTSTAAEGLGTVRAELQLGQKRPAGALRRQEPGRRHRELPGGGGGADHPGAGDPSPGDQRGDRRRRPRADAQGDRPDRARRPGGGEGHHPGGALGRPALRDLDRGLGGRARGATG